MSECSFSINWNEEGKYRYILINNVDNVFMEIWSIVIEVLGMRCTTQLGKVKGSFLEQVVANWDLRWTRWCRDFRHEQKQERGNHKQCDVAGLWKAGNGCKIGLQRDWQKSDTIALSGQILSLNGVLLLIDWNPSN